MASGGWSVKGQGALALVLAGRKGWLVDPILRRVDELGLGRQVRFLDYVEAADMAALYSGARAFVFPSLYEGFGFPVLEAMACGTPVICSNTSSLPEVAGDAALLVDPADAASIAGGIERVLADAAVRAKLVQRGFEQARKFSWERAARETMAVLEEAARTKRKKGAEGHDGNSFSEKTRVSGRLHSPPDFFGSIASPRPVSILGIPVHDVTYVETLALVETFVAQGGPHQICTANPEFVMAAQHDREFAGILQRADLVLPDGIGLVWASRWLAGKRRSGIALRERVAGSTLTWRLADLAARRGWRVYFLGAAEGVAARAAEVLQGQHPELVVAGTYAGSPRADEEDAIAERVRAAQPHLLLVAYGAPGQDKWIARNAARLGVPVMMGVGGSLDFIAGVTARAPSWMQSLGLEWLHRLLRQPWRWRRMLALPKFVLKVLLNC